MASSSPNQPIVLDLVVSLSERKATFSFAFSSELSSATKSSVCSFVKSSFSLHFVADFKNHPGICRTKKNQALQ